MKYIIIIFMAVLVLNSCSRQPSLVGSWEVVSCPTYGNGFFFSDCRNGDTLAFNFRENHSFSMLRSGKSTLGHYEITGDTLLLYGALLRDQVDVFIIKRFTENDLCLYGRFSSDMVLRRF